VNPGDCIDAAPGNIESDQISTNIEMFSALARYSLRTLLPQPEAHLRLLL